MIKQVEFQLPAMKRGCHLITGYVIKQLQDIMPREGILNVFVKHTSCALTVNENADPDVRVDLNNILDHLVPENQSYYEHTMEGPDDMPSHAKCSMLGVSLNIPITAGRLNLGMWQGIYLCEFRDYGGPRSLVLTVFS